MKILTVSDHVEPPLYEQFQAGRFPGINLILACGDLPPEYLTFLVTSFNVPLFYVRGNHDIRPGGYRLEGCIDYDCSKKTKVVNSYGYYIFKIEDGRYTE